MKDFLDSIFFFFFWVENEVALSFNLANFLSFSDLRALPFVCPWNNKSNQRFCSKFGACN